MILVLLLVLPLAGGAAAWIAARRSPLAARWISLGALGLDLVLAASLWTRSPAEGSWLVRLDLSWIPELGIGFRLGVDGLSLLLIVLTLGLGILSVAASWTEIRERVGFFHFNLLWILAGILGVFLALDLVLFYFFWELMLVPMYFLIGIWGHERRIYAAIKFFLFTQASGLLMLVSILGLALAHRGATGELTFAYDALLGTDLEAGLARWLFLGFFVAFAVKLPAVPFHTWLPDAHTEAPTAGSVVLAGLLLKTGAYGLLRFGVPLFPTAARELAPVALILGAVGILYGGALAFAQTDLKRLVAYTSVAHLGFVLVGIFAWNRLALQGAVLQMICHGLSTGALFILVGAVQERLHTRDLDKLGGLWKRAPRMGAAATIFAMASLGLPGLGNFVAEILVLVGAFRVTPTWTAIAATGLVVATVYSLWIVQRAFHGPLEIPDEISFPDLGAREIAVFAVMTLALVWLGLYPQPVLETAREGLAAAETAVHAALPGELWP